MEQKTRERKKIQGKGMEIIKLQTYGELSKPPSLHLNTHSMCKLFYHVMRLKSILMNTFTFLSFLYSKGLKAST